MASAGTILLAVFLVLILLIALSVVALFFLRRQRARNHGLDPPSINPFANSSFFSRGPSSHIRPARGGALGWIERQFDGFRNKRTVGGAYERTGRRQGGGALDPDEAWDARAGADAYEEEAELGLHSHQRSHSEFEGQSYGTYSAPRGRRTEFEQDTGYAGLGGAVPASKDPFGDSAERSDMSLRGVSPRPAEEGPSEGQGDRGGRRSAFREDM